MPELSEGGINKEKEGEQEGENMSISPKDRLSGWARKWEGIGREREDGSLKVTQKFKGVGGRGREAGSHMVLSAIYSANICTYLR